VEASNLLRSYGAVIRRIRSAASRLMRVGAEESPLCEAEWIER